MSTPPPTDPMFPNSGNEPSRQGPDSAFSGYGSGPASPPSATHPTDPQWTHVSPYGGQPSPVPPFGGVGPGTNAHPQWQTEPSGTTAPQWNPATQHSGGQPGGPSAAGTVSGGWSQGTVPGASGGWGQGEVPGASAAGAGGQFPSQHFGGAGHGVMPNHNVQFQAYGPPQSQKSYLVSWLLALFLGGFGADRFYRGFIGLGILKLITCGGAGVWALVDLALLLFLGGKDSRGLPLAGYQKHKALSWAVTAVVVVLGLISPIGGGGDSTSPEAEAPSASQGVADEPSVSASAEPADAATTAEPAASTAPAQPAPQTAAAPDVPAAQSAMTQAVATARTDAESADTDLQRANVLNVRSDALCGAVPEGKVDSWVGTVKTVDANGEGKAVVVVEIDEDIEIGTWNNALSDAGDGTLIEQGTPLFDQALALSPGDQVKFSGVLKSGDSPNDKCFYTSNMTETMSIESPDYIITFESLEKVA